MNRAVRVVPTTLQGRTSGKHGRTAGGVEPNLQNPDSMRTRLFSLVILIATALFSGGLIGCNRKTDRRDDEAARQAGRDAYQGTQALKHDANQAARKLHDAGNQFREGWNQAKHDNEDKPKPDK